MRTISLFAVAAGLAACAPMPPAEDLSGDALRDRLADHKIVLTAPPDAGPMEPTDATISFFADGNAEIAFVMPGGIAIGMDGRWVVRDRQVCVIQPGRAESGGQCATITIAGDRVISDETQADGSVVRTEGRILPL